MDEEGLKDHKSKSANSQENTKKNTTTP